MIADEPIVPPGSANAILDTNVALAIYSWHDVLKIGDEVLLANPDESLEQQDIKYRIDRQRTALHLALFFDEHSWKVAVPVNEFIRKLDENVLATDAATTNFKKLQLFFIRKTLMPNWLLCGDDKADVGIVGNNVDRLCLDWAEEHEIPLISWEGWGRNGLDKTKLIPREAARRGIDHVSPEQFLTRSNFDRARAVKRFLAKWNAEIGAYAAKTPGAAAFLEHVQPFYEYLVKGNLD